MRQHPQRETPFKLAQFAEADDGYRDEVLRKLCGCDERELSVAEFVDGLSGTWGQTVADALAGSIDRGILGPPRRMDKGLNRASFGYTLMQQRHGMQRVLGPLLQVVRAGRVRTHGRVHDVQSLIDWVCLPHKEASPKPALTRRGPLGWLLVPDHRAFFLDDCAEFALDHLADTALMQTALQATGSGPDLLRKLLAARSAPPRLREGPIPEQLT